MNRAMCLMRAGVVWALLHGPALAADGVVVGWVELARLEPGGLLVHAKLDTGAESSSINAADIAESVRDGTRWVTFTVADRDGGTVRFERPVRRIARIRRAGTEAQERPVVELGVCIGATYAVTDFTLTDRRGMDYQVLIGRRFLADRLLVDSNSMYTAKPSCP